MSGGRRQAAGSLRTSTASGCHACLALALLLTAAGCQQVVAEPEGYVIPPGRENLIVSLPRPFEMGAEIVPGWELGDISITRDSIRYAVEGADGEAALILQPPSGAGGERSASFLFERATVSGADEALNRLAEAIRRNDAGDFWKSEARAFRSGAYFAVTPFPRRGVLLALLFSAFAWFAIRRRRRGDERVSKLKAGMAASGMGLLAFWLGEVTLRSSGQQLLLQSQAPDVPLLAMWWAHLALTAVLLTVIAGAVFAAGREQRGNGAWIFASIAAGIALVALMTPSAVRIHMDTAVDLMLAQDALRGAALVVGVGPSPIAGALHGTLTVDAVTLGTALGLAPAQILFVLLLCGVLAHVLLLPLFTRHAPAALASAILLLCIVGALEATSAVAGVMWTPASMPLAAALLLGTTIIYSRRPTASTALLLAGAQGLCIDAHGSGLFVLPVTVALTCLLGATRHVLILVAGAGAVLALRSPGQLASLVGDLPTALPWVTVVALAVPALAGLVARRSLGTEARHAVADWAPAALALPWGLLLLAGAVSAAYHSSHDLHAPRLALVFLPAAGYAAVRIIGPMARRSTVLHLAALVLVVTTAAAVVGAGPRRRPGRVSFMPAAERLGAFLGKRGWTLADLRQRLLGFERRDLVYSVMPHLGSQADSSPAEARPLAVIAARPGELEPADSDMLLAAAGESLLLRRLPRWVDWNNLRLCLPDSDRPCESPPVRTSGLRWAALDPPTPIDRQMGWTLEVDLGERPGADPVWIDVLDTDGRCRWRVARNQPDSVRREAGHRAIVAPGPRTMLRLELPDDPACKRSAALLIPPGLLVTRSKEKELRRYLDEAIAARSG